MIRIKKYLMLAIEELSLKLKLLMYYHVKSYKVTPKGIDTNGAQVMGSSKIQVKFNKVNKFYVYHSHFDNVQDFPNEIKKILVIQYCRDLKSLVGLPKQIEVVEIGNCPITSMQGFPIKCKEIKLEYMPVTSLKGMLNTVCEGDISLLNLDITNLHGIPKSFKRLFIVGCKKLTSIDGIKLAEYVHVSAPIKQLKGIDNLKLNYFYCDSDELINLKGCPDALEIMISGKNFESLLGIHKNVKSVRLVSTKLKGISKLLELQIKKKYGLDSFVTY